MTFENAMEDTAKAFEVVRVAGNRRRRTCGHGVRPQELSKHEPIFCRRETHWFDPQRNHALRVPLHWSVDQVRGWTRTDRSGGV